MTIEDVVGTIAPHLEPGDRIAIADGAGAPTSLLPALERACAIVGGTSWFMGWMFELPVELEPSAVTDASTYMGGYALREAIESGRVRYLPERLSALPRRLREHLRPDVVLLSVRPGSRGLVFGSEIAWMRAALEEARVVLVRIDHGLPDASDGVPLPTDDRICEVEEVCSGPREIPSRELNPVAADIGRHIARLVPENATLQYSPGHVGVATLAALDRPVHICSGLLTDDVVDLDERGLLLSAPISTYLVGTRRLYRWANGQRVLAPVEHTHDLSRLMSRPRFTAVNTALEVDLVGQVNVEKLGRFALAGVGGQPDFAGAASRAHDGLSIIALPTARAGRTTLVNNLSAPTSTTRSDVDLVVTEQGIADLRGCDDTERERRLRTIWEGHEISAAYDEPPCP